MPTKIYFNQITVIQSLKANEPQTGTDLCKDIIERKIDQLIIQNLKAKVIDVPNKKELVKVLENLKFKLGDKKILPYIHFEMHGRKEGLVLKNDEIITWEELQPLLISVNESIRNYLFISLATCFGGNILNSINLLKKSPFFGFVGSENKIYLHELRQDWEAYFVTLLEKNDFNLAVEELNKPKEIYDSELVSKPRYLFYTSEIVFDLTALKWQESFLDRERKVTEMRKTISEQAVKMNSGRDMTDGEVYQSWQYSLLRVPSFIEELKDHFLFNKQTLPKY